MPTNDPAATSKERLSYNVRAVIEGLRDEMRLTDDQLEEVIAEFVASLEDDGVIDRGEAMDILVLLIRAYKGHGDTLNVVDLWAESSTEAALRKSERVQQKRKSQEAAKTR